MIPQADKSIPIRDIALAEQAASGDAGAKRTLVERLMPKVRTTIHYLAPQDRDADDLVQSAFIEILRSVHLFRGESRLETWATRIAVRCAVAQLRTRRRRFRLLAPEPDVGEPADNQTPERSSEQYQLRRHIRALLQNLSVDQRTVIVLKLVHGMSMKEIADVTDTPLNTARERLRVGRKQFRRLMLQDPVLRDWIERRER